MRVYITAYLQGRRHIDGIEVPSMDVVPPVGSTLHYDDRAWHVDHLSWVLGEGSFGDPGKWHVEMAVSAL